MAALDATSPAASASKRPAAVSIVAAVGVVAAAYFIVDGALVLRNAESGDTSAIVDGCIGLGLGVLTFVAAVGALRMRSWAWKLLMTLTVAGLTIQILRALSFGDPRYGRMALSAFVVFALTPRDVQVAFGIRPPPNADFARPTRNPLDRD